ncbi:hypothetical protein FQN60_009268 [Etheostoma spectabile]|uniref:Uncharacterized protein n=1 Tax=Etheostoma spectabile TaxID=54343 RepID=A0A5J5DIG8_9PERO|nr:hypothetical protein FQN60_009268 [Etheostoma spectabile]
MSKPDTVQAAVWEHKDPTMAQGKKAHRQVGEHELSSVGLSTLPTPTPLTHAASRYESDVHMWKHRAHGNSMRVQPVDTQVLQSLVCCL